MDVQQVQNPVNENAERMNDRQRDLFNLIKEKIEEQVKGYGDRVRMFISGSAGTGKTFMINLIREQIRRSYGGKNNSVKVGAYTNRSAMMIEGQTLHSLFKLKYETGPPKTFDKLTDDELEVKRPEWLQTQFLIIDDILMVSYEMLEHFDSCLQQLKASSELFGGINILLFGDLMMLPPVGGARNYVFDTAYFVFLRTS